MKKKLDENWDIVRALSTDYAGICRFPVGWQCTRFTPLLTPDENYHPDVGCSGEPPIIIHLIPDVLFVSNQPLPTVKLNADKFVRKLDIAFILLLFSRFFSLPPRQTLIIPFSPRTSPRIQRLLCRTEYMYAKKNYICKK